VNFCCVPLRSTDPMVHVEFERPCVMCMMPANKQCSGCKGFWYCGVECQRKHWRSHKLECGKVRELQHMTPTELLDVLEKREKEFHAASDVVRNHREQSSSKMVWLTRSGGNLHEDLQDARNLPGIKNTLDAFDETPETHKTELVSTLFSATEGVGRAKSMAYFESMKGLRERLLELAAKDAETGQTTRIQVDGAPVNSNTAVQPAVPQAQDGEIAALASAGLDVLGVARHSRKGGEDTLEIDPVEGVAAARTARAAQVAEKRLGESEERLLDLCGTLDSQANSPPAAGSIREVD